MKHLTERQRRIATFVQDYLASGTRRSSGRRRVPVTFLSWRRGRLACNS